jgi:hypothetical protein
MNTTGRFRPPEGSDGTDCFDEKNSLPDCFDETVSGALPLIRDHLESSPLRFARSEALMSGQELQPLTSDDPLLTPADAGRYLRPQTLPPVAGVTLRRWRAEGTGPDYVLMGRFPYYRKSALDRYLGACERSPKGRVGGSRNAPAHQSPDGQAA